MNNELRKLRRALIELGYTDEAINLARSEKQAEINKRLSQPNIVANKEKTSSSYTFY